MQRNQESRHHCSFRTTFAKIHSIIMSKQIKLIWDFRGSDSFPIAQHHQIHLEEFIKKENLQLQETGTNKINASYSIAYMMVSEPEMLKVRDALRPHRGELITFDD